MLRNKVYIVVNRAVYQTVNSQVLRLYIMYDVPGTGLKQVVARKLLPRIY